MTDPLGGVNTLWPLFGVANQMLAAVALTLCTVVIFRMKRERYAWVTILPTIWLVACTLTDSPSSSVSPRAMTLTPSDELCPPPLGCAGGVTGLSIAARLAEARPGSNVLLVAVNLDPHRPQEADVEIPRWRANSGEPVGADQVPAIV